MRDVHTNWLSWATSRGSCALWKLPERTRHGNDGEHAQRSSPCRDPFQHRSARRGVQALVPVKPLRKRFRFRFRVSRSSRGPSLTIVRLRARSSVTFVLRHPSVHKAVRRHGRRVLPEQAVSLRTRQTHLPTVSRDAVRTKAPSPL
ncbi:hypothetical protein MRX96_000733 [Rhipicephalus microplus]